MKKTFLILLMAALSYVAAWGSDTLSLAPSWYVAPEIPASLRAPMRANAAASCKADSVLTFNIDSILTEVTTYTYDNAGRTTCTTVWSCAADGTRTGKSKNEYSYDQSGTQTMTASYIWDSATNGWIGTQKSEYTYASFTGRKMMTSNTTSIWIDNTWVADQRYIYDYDAAVRQTRYFELKRNTTTNKLDSVKGFVKAWTNGLLTLDAQYNTYANGQWTVGSKSEWSYNADSVLTMQATYPSMANGKFVGSSKEEWNYTDSTLTMHATYGWSNGGWAGAKKEEWSFADSKQILYQSYIWASNAWSLSLKEENEYDGDNLIRVENYSYANGVPTGTKKETTTYDSGKKTEFVAYTWSNGAWTNATMETWAFTNGKQTLHEQFVGEGANWSKTLHEENEYSGANLIRVENYSYANGVPTGLQFETTTYTSGKKTEYVTYTWSNGAWMNSTKETWVFTNGKQTLHEQFVGEGANWSKTLEEENEYDGANLIRVENYSYTNGVPTGTKKETAIYTSGNKTESVTYTWSNGVWVNSTKDTWGFTNGQKTLHEQFVWENSDWSKTLREENEYSGANLIRVENYSYENGVATGTQKEEYTYAGSTKTQVLIYQWYNNAWMYQTKETWAYTSGKLTDHEKAGWNGLEWIPMQHEIAGYDAAGNQTLVENYLLLTSGWTGTKKEEYAYTNGAKTQTIVYAWENDAWVYSTKHQAGYQDGNTEVSETNYTWNGTLFQGVGNRVMTTTENDLITEKITQNWPDNATDWTNASITRNTYNAEGENILTYNGTWNGSRWTVSSMTKMERIIDEQGRQLLKATWQCGSDSIWKGIQKDTTKYSATGKVLYSACFKGWKNNAWVAYYKVEYIYDAADRLLEQQRMEWSSNKWVGKYRYEYSYDVEGRQTMSATYNGWNSTYKNWVGTSKTENAYDQYGQVSELINSIWRSNAWAPFQKYLYVRDNQNRILEQILQSYSNGTWINLSKSEKEYKGSIVVSENTYVWSNGTWILNSLKESIYDEDEQAKLRREIVGSWISGVVKSYEDKHYMYDCDQVEIRYVNYDGTILEIQTLDKGVTPFYTGETPTRPADVEHTYAFSGWTPAISPVTGPATYTATFGATDQSYTITWLNEDGTQIDQTTVLYGAMPTHAEVSKASDAEYTYTFAGWNPGLGIVTGDATYTATFNRTKNSYTISWLNWDNTSVGETNVEYGVTPEAPSTPTKPADDEYIYTFAAWTPEIVPVTGNATYTATYEAKNKSYTVTWLNEDGTQVDQTTVQYGATPAHANINKESTAEYDYTFAGWSPEFVPVTGDATYTATFDSIKRSYTITWLNSDDSPLGTTTVEYGVVPVHEDPTKVNTAEYDYTFVGWTPEIVPVTGDATYTATFDSIKRSYTVTWLNSDDSPLGTTTVEYGVVPVHEDPTKVSTAEYDYTFVGWTPEIVPVTVDATYTATFDSIKRSYTITWLNSDNSPLGTTTVEYGVVPVHEDPTKESTAEYDYTFAGWSPEIVPVTGEATYTATFDSIKRSYTITWLNSDDSPLGTTTVEYGVVPVHEDLTKVSTAEYDYTFAGWSPTITAVTGDATYTANFDSIKRSYTVTWLNAEGVQVDQTTVEYGITPTHANINKESTAEYTYVFAAWLPEIVPVTGNATYQATFDSIKNSYAITWLNSDNSPLSQSSVEYGVIPTHEEPTKVSTAEYDYNFAGWTPTITAVTGDATYTATFTPTKRSYAITWLDAEGTQVDQTTVEYGATPSHAAITKADGAGYSYTFKAWIPALEPVTGDATYQAIFDSIAETYTITFYFENGETVLDQVQVAYGEIPSTDLIPSKNSEEHYYYTFDGWYPEIVPATGNASYVATYKAIPQQYTITFKNYNGWELEKTTADYGTIPVYTGETPTKPKDKHYTYVFAGWSPELTEVTGPATYTAVFEGIVNQYTVIFLDADGTELDRQEVDYGTIPSPAVIPTKEDDEQYTYTFAGWNPKLTTVTRDATYKATYSKRSKTQGLGEQTPSDSPSRGEKVLRDGQIFILRGGKTYTIDGIEVNE